MEFTSNGVVWWPADVLKTKAAEILTFDNSVAVLSQDLTETMKSNSGIGLAAPQLGKSIRMFVMAYKPPLLREYRTRVVCNPMVETSGPEEADIEGCLSMPGVRNQVWRPSKVYMKFQYVDGTPREMYLEGLEARIVQHELDHLNGIMFTDRMTRQIRRATLRDYEKLLRKMQRCQR